MNYIKIENKNERVIRTEILFTPVLVFLPFLVGIFFIFDWYIHGFVEGIFGYEGELILGFIIVIGNLIFDIPFIRALYKLTKIKNSKK